MSFDAINSLYNDQLERKYNDIADGSVLNSVASDDGTKSTCII